MNKIEWHEAGNRIYKTGHIRRTKIPIWIWVLDKWFERHPHWEWWDNLWFKINPNWGDPLCAAYCFVWSNFVWDHTKEEYHVEVGFDKLSQDYRDWYSKDLPEDDDES